MTFKNQAEIFQALLDGKKLRMSLWDAGQFIHMVNNDLVNENGTRKEQILLDIVLSKWQIYTEPVAPEKKEAREWWMNRYTDGVVVIYGYKAAAIKAAALSTAENSCETVQVREVLPEPD